ncbi:DUF3426 domain-containing protein [Aromatoleum diolicum]|uniref:DUF3426 domain-containing protein n=1 Tax=Aromatoleum diolicum TaxID=75796 RepID=A0ABX1QCG0_9RHOO|nr:DUF3426 domain-containing protein [Aromatoleum diolicum]NMG76086.1 DUF3426 domain-containing protein [Aromatoleum diolicum]
MFARCPACHTVFRVRPEQLRAHLGQVRCGNCLNAFNALEHLQEEPPPTRAAPSAIPATPAQVQVSPTAQPVPPTASAEAPDRLDSFFVLEDKTEDSFSDQLDFEIPDALVAPRNPAGQAASTRVEPDTYEAPSFTFESSAPHDQTPDAAATPFVEIEPWSHIGSDGTEPFVASPTRDQINATSSAEPEAGLSAEPETELPFPQAPGVASAPVSSGDAAFIPPASEIENEKEAESGTRQAAEPDFSHLDETYGPAAAPPGRRWLSGLGIGVLAGTLAAQSIYLFRAEIARDWPALRPALVAACQALNCSVALPRVAGAISVEASDLQAEPGKPGRFLLNATIRNRAPHPQAYPHLELTLTDARDRPLARRVLTPQDWTPGADIEGGFDAGRDIAVTLPFEAPGLDAAGYRIYVFYP